MVSLSLVQPMDQKNGSNPRELEQLLARIAAGEQEALAQLRSEEHTSELQSPTHISYAVFCLKKTFF